MTFGGLIRAFYISLIRVTIILFIPLFVLPIITPDYSGNPKNELGIELRNNGHLKSPLIEPKVVKLTGKWNENQSYRKKAEEITARLNQATGNPNLQIKIIISEKAAGGVACADRSKNTISISPLVFLISKSDDELAAIIAHEIGHLLYNPMSFHHLYFNNRNIPDTEAQADIISVNLLSKAGYNPVGAMLAFQTLHHEADGDMENPNDTDHPLMKDRIQLINDIIIKYYPSSISRPIYQRESLSGKIESAAADMRDLLERITPLRNKVSELETKLNDPYNYYTTKEEYEKDYSIYQELNEQLDILAQEGQVLVKNYQDLIKVMNNIASS